MDDVRPIGPDEGVDEPDHHGHREAGEEPLVDAETSDRYALDGGGEGRRRTQRPRRRMSEA